MKQILKHKLELIVSVVAFVTAFFVGGLEGSTLIFATIWIALTFYIPIKLVLFAMKFAKSKKAKKWENKADNKIKQLEKIGRAHV